MGKPGFPTPPPRKGMGKPGFPMPPPARGFGRAQPSQEQPYVHCGVVRRSRMEGYREHTPSARGVGKPGFPTLPPRRRARPARRGMGNPGFLIPYPVGGCGRARPSQEEPLFILFVCGGAAWMAGIITARRERWRAAPAPSAGTVCCVGAASHGVTVSRHLVGTTEGAMSHVRTT